MAKIALRVYNNEIKDLTDHGQIEEAIAHCRHILETYPKHVDTYRLLGKAYLEEQRYGDAADILQRVLSSIPEDFISQVGMSIIREDEGNLDTAIFHMERAFEVQPSNHAIQDELKRLYGRRDGIEPQKIRLTRGALARMYAHGNLHDLAIAELLAALSEDPQRYDLMVLLANMYFQADKPIEAAEICTKILEKLPYCLDANRLLATILEASNREENAKIYRDRWEELDPYAVALDKGNLNTEFVSNQTITVDRLDWEPGSYDDGTVGRPAWATSLGVDFQGDPGKGSALPDWMSKREEEVEPTESFFGGPNEERELPPLWESTPDHEPEDIKSSGLTPESPKIDDSFFASEKPREDSLFPSEDEEEESPEWLRTPTEESPEKLDESMSSEGEEIPDWMQTPTDSAELQQEENLFPPEGEEEGTPEWMSSLQDESQEQPIAATDDSEEIPDFMKEAGWQSSSDEAESSIPAFSDDQSDEQEEEIAEGEIPTWMQDLAPPEDKPEPGPFSQEEIPLAGDMQEEAVQDTQAASEEKESPETPAWLSQIENPEEGELVTSPEEHSETPPDWLQESTEEEEPQSGKEDDLSMEWLDQLSQEAAEEAAIASQTEPPPQIEETPPVTEISGEAPAPSAEEDEGLGWLESLAAKQGVAEEELVTSPEERSETPPDWLQDTAEEEEPQPEKEDDLSMEWLDQISQEAAQEAALASQTEPPPQIEETPPVTEISGEAPAPSAEEDEGLGWLESLAAKQGVDEEELVTSPEERSESPPDWLQEATEEEEPQPESREEPSMDWLDQLSQEAAEEVLTPPTSEDMPIEEAENWLDRLSPPEEPPAAPVSESLAPEPETGDDLSMEWLDQVGQEGVEGSAPSEESGDEAGEEVEAWLGSLEYPTEASETLGSGTIDEEADEGLAWLENLAEGGAGDEELPEPSVQESAPEELVSDISDEEPPEWLLPEKEETTEETLEEEPSLDWLTEMSQESPSEGEGEKEVKVSTDWLNEMTDIEDDLETEEELSSTPEAIDKVDEWIQSLDRPIKGWETTLEPESEQAPIEPDAETVVSIPSTEETIVEPPAETIPSYAAEDEPTKVEEPEPETPMVPEWLQDVAEQKPEPDAIEKPPEWLPDVEEPGMESEEVAPTRPSEWQPEAEVKAQPVEEETQPTPTSEPSPQESLDMLEEARQAMHEHKLDEAIDAYAKLIKRGKAIEETIEDIEEALRKHPINPVLWQVLGDALMRSDRLQEALDAYSKAEDLLR